MAARDRKPIAIALLLLALAAPSLALADSSSAVSTSLAAGEQGSYSWTVEASRLAGSRPCVGVAITHHYGPFSYARSRFHDCGPAGPARSTPPLLVGGTHIGGADGSRITVFGILAATGARRVRLTVSDGLEAERIGARLEPIAARAGRARNLRFAIIAVPGRQCVERLATESGIGKTLWQGTLGEHSCDAE